MEVLLTWTHSQFDAADANAFREGLLERLNTDNEPHERTGLVEDIPRLPQASPWLSIPTESLKRLQLTSSSSPWRFGKTSGLNFSIGTHTKQHGAQFGPLRTKPSSEPFLSTTHLSNCDLSPLPTEQDYHHHHRPAEWLDAYCFSSHLASMVAPVCQSSTIMDHRRNLPSAPPCRHRDLSGYGG